MGPHFFLTKLDTNARTHAHTHTHIHTNVGTDTCGFLTFSELQSALQIEKYIDWLYQQTQDVEVKDYRTAATRLHCRETRLNTNLRSLTCTLWWSQRLCCKINSVKQIHSITVRHCNSLWWYWEHEVQLKIRRTGSDTFYYNLINSKNAAVTWFVGASGPFCALQWTILMMRRALLPLHRSSSLSRLLPTLPVAVSGKQLQGEGLAVSGCCFASLSHRQRPTCGGREREMLRWSPPAQAGVGVSVQSVEESPCVNQHSDWKGSD